MDVQSRLDDIVAAVRNARAMPMSASCVVNRAELLGLLEEVRDALPGSLAQARELLGGREQMVAEAQEEAQRIIEAARTERGSMVSDTEVARRSQAEADRILAEARREAESIRAEADDYVDSKLANFEVVLSKTIDSVGRGKDKLLGRATDADAPFGHDPEQGHEGPAAPERSADPDELRERADTYVEAQFQAFESVLTKTLDAVGRGRKKLTGHRPMDELGAHLAAQEEAGADGHHQVHVSDAEYLAGLAEPQADIPAQAQPPVTEPVPPGGVPEPTAPPQPAPAAPAPADPYAPAAAYDQGGFQPAYGQEADPYQQGGYAYPPQPGYAQQGYPPQPVPEAPQPGHPGGYAEPDPYGYPQQAYPDGYGQVPAYGTEAGYPQQGTGGYPQQHAQHQHQAEHQHQHQAEHQHQHQAQYQAQAPALDETSFFDTSMIDMEELRRYEQGR
ncbi:ATP synthase F0 subunit B [Streptomyces sp. JJ38]|uniref:ATP synthase F0 subunit B n=1 Tax=Streptomyces sp. JJ38 TaxID=2738128 RepID=UPI001C59B692|nr:ATP synthase F0 subunit B [Streptomyces sp. JJ38]MBW1598159.1 cell division initiation protein [Streptomyces sp. JJ38]